MIQFERPKDQSSIIKIIGVGGGGGNAVNYMYDLGIDGVDFVVCNTDSQALAQSQIPNKIQLGPHLTQGLGAGANPEIGKQAGEESIEDITKILKVRTRMAFITAGMGGGTGTGAAPIIAKVCKDLDILTVGIVTTPFAYEGPKRLKQAQAGIDAMRDHVDTILIISNDKLRQQFGNLPFTQAFAKADNILSTAAKCITDLITVDGRVNLDFNDVQTVMKKGGVAILGSAQAEGEDRAKTAVVEALNSPLLNDSEIQGAKWILLNITSAAGDYEHTLDELEIIQSFVQEQAGNTCDIILGMGHDPNLGEKLAVTIIATGFQYHEINTDMPTSQNAETIEKVILSLDQKDTAVATPKAAPEPASSPLSPRLVERANEVNVPVALYEAKPMPPVEAKQTFSLELPQNEVKKDEGNTDAFRNTVLPQQEKKQPQDIELVIKNRADFEQPQAASRVSEPLVSQNMTVESKAGTRPLTEFEIEEKRQFEEQKRAFEERAERLRRMSFNYRNQDKADEMERVPAYQRQQVDFDKEGNSYDNNFLSGYYVEGNRDTENRQSNIRTINTFLDGKRPD